MESFELPLRGKRELVWLGDSEKNLKEFPEEVQRQVKVGLEFVQRGEIPKNAKPSRKAGSGVFGLIVIYETYEYLLQVKLDDKIYVSGAFRLRKLVWLGSTEKNREKFPEKVQEQTSESLLFMQRGITPPNAELCFKHIGSGIFKIPIDNNTNTYRVVVAVKLGEKIYVLHAFQKKSPRDRETRKEDMDLIEKRYQRAQRMSKS